MRRTLFVCLPVCRSIFVGWCNYTYECIHSSYYSDRFVRGSVTQKGKLFVEMCIGFYEVDEKKRGLRQPNRFIFTPRILWFRLFSVITEKGEVLNRFLPSVHKDTICIVLKMSVPMTILRRFILIKRREGIRVGVGRLRLSDVTGLWR